MEKIRISSTQWGVGIFCTLLGAMLLVVPHQFGAPAYSFLLPALPVWGLLFLCAGFALLSISVLVPPFWIAALVHLLSAGLIFRLVVGFWQTHELLGIVQYGALTAALLIAIPRLKFPLSTPHSREQTDLLTLTMGLAALTSGLILLSSRAEEMSALPGSLLVLSGLLLVIWQTAGLSAVDNRPAFFTSRRLAWEVHLLAGFTFFAAMYWLATPPALWPNLAYFGTFGLALILLPWLMHRVQASTPTTLRTRVALILGVTTTVPLILTVALISGEVELSVQADTLERQENQAAALARTVEDYVSLHRAALQALSRQPGLMELPRSEQTRLINIYARAYPDTTSFSMFDSNGAPIVRSDGIFSPFTIRGIPLFEEALATGKGSLDILISPVLNLPVLVFGEPVSGNNGEFLGLITFSLSSNRVADFLYHQAGGRDGPVYLVDDHGRTISHPDAAIVANFEDFSSVPPVRKILYGPESTGSLTYTIGQETYLAGYARLNNLNWGIVSERTTASALAGVRAGRDMAFGILLIFLVMTTAAGVALASAFSLPLTTLANAAREMADENPLAPIPTSRIVEIQHLVDRFHEMRMRLAARTAERERAESGLRRAKEELAARVMERTEELKNANQLLQDELVIRRKAEEALRESQERLVLATDAVEIGYWHWDLARDVLDCTDRCKALLGVPGETNVTYREFLALIHPSDREKVGAGIDDAIQRRTRYELEFRVLPPAGEPVWLMNLGRAIYSEDGQPLRMMGAIFDITGRKRAEEELRLGEARREMQHHLTQYRDGERLRIAQDLHDGPLQDLIAMNMSISDAMDQARGTQFFDVLQNMRETLYIQIRDLRAFCNELRPPALTPFGLEKAIRSHADSFLNTHPELNLSLDLTPDGRLLAEPVRLAFFQIYKESLANIMKHSGATDVFVRLCLEDPDTILEIEDNGVGFQVPDDWLELARQGHLGLVGARERAEAVGGQLWVQSVPGEGTLVRVTAPRPFPLPDETQPMLDISKENGTLL